MRVRSSPREKTLLVGILLTFVALGALAAPNLSETFRIAAGFCLAFGALLYKGAFLVRAWDTGPIAKIQKSSNGYFWLKVAAVVLWLGAVPLTFLWLYDHLHRP